MSDGQPSLHRSSSHTCLMTFLIYHLDIITDYKYTIFCIVTWTPFIPVCIPIPASLSPPTVIPRPPYIPLYSFHYANHDSYITYHFTSQLVQHIPDNILVTIQIAHPIVVVHPTVASSTRV